MNTPADPSTPLHTPSRPSRYRPHWGVVSVALVLTPLIVKGYTDVSDGLRAGSDTPASNTVNANSTALGKNNSVGGTNALAVGEANNVSGLDGNFASGKQNSVNGLSNVAFGNGNSIAGGVLTSAVWGQGNSIAYQGRHSTAGGYYNNVYAHYGHALGTVLTNNSYGSMVVGYYNAPFNNDDVETAARTSWRSGDAIFVVGNGTSSSNRSNALVVTKGGTTHLTNLVVSGTAVLPRSSIGGSNTTSVVQGLAMGHNNTVSGFQNTAFGVDNSVNGYQSTALGNGNQIGGSVSQSYALGKGNTINNGVSYAAAIGLDNELKAVGGKALGRGLKVNNNDAVVVGLYNQESAAPGGNPAGHLFVVGNGTADNARSNAFVITKNGDVTVTGKITLTAPAGDIPMFVP